MKSRISCVVMLAAALAAPPVFAQASAPAAANNVDNAVDPAAVDAIKAMGAYLHSLGRFSVSTELTGESVLQDGQKLQHSASAVLDVDRPHRLRAVMTGAGNKREIIVDGKTVTLYSPAQKYYSTVPFDGTLADLIGILRDKYGVELPLSDLFVWAAGEARTDQFESALYAGREYIGTDPCDHYAFRQKGLDWQIWISAGANPVPRKIVITRRDDEARPQSVSILNWTSHPTFGDSAFRFQPPAGAKRIDLAPVAANKG